MGKVIRDEDLRLNIIVNGNKGMKELGDLEQATRKLKEETSDLRKEKAKLTAEGKKGTAEYKELTAAIKKNNTAISSNKERMSQLKKQVGITGLTFRQLKQEARKLRTVLDNTIPGTAEWKKYSAELKKVDAQILKVKGTAGGMKASMGKLADGFNKYFGMLAAGSAAIFGLVASGKELITGNAKLSDSYADVAKTTGLTVEEVKDLAKNLKQIDTRTSRSELLGLAEMAGKLGVTGKQNIEGFVKSADQINVALGKDLGGNAEEAIKQVGKLVDIFKVEDEFGLNEGMIKVGSTINALGAASTANEGYIVEFGKRMAGIAPAADISIESILGLGATLDSLGQTSEVSSTVFSQIIPNMFKDTATYADIAGQSTAEFSKLLNEDANEALIQVLEGLNGNNDGLGVMARKLDELGLGGKKSISVLGVMAKNTETLREQQALANQSFAEGTSLTQEFNLKNTNLAATLDKISKRLSGMFVNSAVTDGLKSIVGHVERWTRTPLSETLEQERLELRKLEFKLTDTNTKHGEKVKLINELKKQYPGYLDNIDAETVSSDELRKALKSVNDMLINKIVLQKEDENIAEQNRIAAEKKMEVIKQEDNIKERLVKLQEKYNLSLKGEGTILEQSKSLYSYLVNNKLGQGGILINKTAQLGHEIQQLEFLNQQLASYTNNADKAVKAKEDLAKRLGITNDAPISPAPFAKETNNNNNEETTVDPELTAEQKRIAAKKKEEAEKLKIRQEWEQRQLDISNYFNKKSLTAYVKYLTDRKTKDTEFLDYYKDLKSKEKQTAIELTKQTLEIEAIERETAYLNELNAVGDNEEAKAEITKRYRLEEIERQKEAVKVALEEAQKAVEEEQNKDGITLFDEKEISDLLLQIAELKNELAELDGQEVEINISTNKSTTESNTKSYNFLGQDDSTAREKINQKEQDDYAMLDDEYGFDDETDPDTLNDEELATYEEYQNKRTEIAQGAADARLDISVQEGLAIAGAVNNLLSQISKYQSAQSNKELAEAKKDSKAKMAILDKELKDGIISRSEYNTRKETLENDLAAKENKIKKEQFENEKKMKIAMAIINTAAAVVMALSSSSPPASYVLAALSAAAGIAEIAVIASTEYTPQAKEGGYQNVVGEDDKKTYNAKVQGQTGGYFPQPTLLVGEKPEYVIPEEGLANPTIAKMLPAIEDARTSGTLQDITPEALFGTATYTAQRATGGFTDDTIAEVEEPEYNESSTEDNSEALLVQTMINLNNTLSKGIVAIIDKDTVSDIADEIDEQNDIENQVSA